MGSSVDPNNNSAIDASVGALVWVRRRNGSWWPGQIMGLDEVSEGSLVSPTSGTPVKLLGREDASIDWYNLEKSKRVKAFRCGEYDECIEKARASAANGNKRAVKYARKEDAIIHALEIENARLDKGCLDYSRKNDFSNEHGFAAKESSSMSLPGKEDALMTDEEKDSASYRDDSNTVFASDSGAGSESDSDAAPQLSPSGASFEELNHVGTSKVISTNGKGRRTPNDSEDDGTEGIKRMRGLEDLGIGVRDSNAGNCMLNGTLVNGSKVYTCSLKRKRSQVAHVHEFLRRKNRRRPLTKVLESTATVSVPVPSTSGSPLQAASDSKISGVNTNVSRKGSSVVINDSSDSNGVSCENGSSLDALEHAYDASHVNGNVQTENNVSGVLQSTESDSSDKLCDVPFVAEEKHSTDSSLLFASTSAMHQVGIVGSQSSTISLAEALPLRSEVLKESVTISSGVTYVNSTNQRIEKGTSRWQSKGKRNSRRKGKSRKRDLRKYPDLDCKANGRLEVKRRLNGLLLGSNQNVDPEGSTGQSLASYKCNWQVKSKMLASDQVDGVLDCSNLLSHKEPDMEGAAGEASLVPQRSLPYRHSRFTVNSRYQSSHFPGKNFSMYSGLHDVKLEVNANCRPQHVPLVSLMNKLNSKAIVGHPLTVVVLDDGYSECMIRSAERNANQAAGLKTANLGFTSFRNSVAGRGRISSKNTRMQPHCSLSKSSKHRKIGLSSKKIRKLSSLTGNRVDHRKPIAPKSKGPVITCIPLKLVFSRLNEAVNGSTRQAHRPSTSGNS